jgi:hypothetical protein
MNYIEEELLRQERLLAALLAVKREPSLGDDSPQETGGRDRDRFLLEEPGGQGSLRAAGLDREFSAGADPLSAAEAGSLRTAQNRILEETSRLRLRQAALALGWSAGDLEGNLAALAGGLARRGSDVRDLAGGLVRGGPVPADQNPGGSGRSGGTSAPAGTPPSGGIPAGMAGEAGFGFSPLAAGRDGAGTDPAALSRVFQRDARRYDGGYALYG